MWNGSGDRPGRARASFAPSTRAPNLAIVVSPALETPPLNRIDCNARNRTASTLTPGTRTRNDEAGGRCDSSEVACTCVRPARSGRSAGCANRPGLRPVSCRRQAIGQKSQVPTPCTANLGSNRQGRGGDSRHAVGTTRAANVHDRHRPGAGCRPPLLAGAVAPAAAVFVAIPALPCGAYTPAPVPRLRRVRGGVDGAATRTPRPERPLSRLPGVRLLQVAAGRGR